MKRGTPEHPKTMALMDALGIGKATAVGLLELLWHFTARFAPRGDIGRFSNRAIANSIDWDRDPDELIAAMVKCGWLDEHTEHRLVVHDWSEHADGAVRLWLSKRKLNFADGSEAYTTSGKRLNCKNGGGQSAQPVNEIGDGPSQTTAMARADGPSQQTVMASADGQCARPIDPSQSQSRSQSQSQSQSRQPEPEPEPAAHAPPTDGQPAGCDESQRSKQPAGGRPDGLPACSTTGQDQNSAANGQLSGLQSWIAAIECAITATVGKPPRADTARKLAVAAGKMGLHPRYVVLWIRDRNGSPPKSDGLFVRAVDTDLAPWARKQVLDPWFAPREQVPCPRCGGVWTQFRDVVVPCECQPLIDGSDANDRR